MSSDRHTILIVDDEVNVLEGLQRTLRHENYTLVTTTSPREALTILNEGGVDIVISDIDMPEITGVELIAEIRKTHPEVVRILLTGDASIESAMEAINDGAVHKYLTKPWSARGLREALRATVVGLGALRREASSSKTADNDHAKRESLEAQFAGITSVSRVDGAYLLNDMRVVEGLAQIANTPFTASAWLPLAAGATLDIKRR